MHELRELGSEEPAEPTEAWVEFASGERMDLKLERTGPMTWTATAPAGRHVSVTGGDHLRLDRLGPGMQVEFRDALAVPPANPE